MAHDTEAQLHATGDDAEWLRGFVGIVGSNVAIPDQLPPPLADGVRSLRAVRRRPWEGELPIDEIAAASFPKLVISGDHSPAFEAVCDSLAERLVAQRAHVVGARHTTPHTGAAFNETLETFMRTATNPRA
jgi:hypothetical protein